MYSLLNFNQSRTPPIQYTKNINGTSFLVEVIGNIQKQFHCAEHYKIRFLSCSCKNDDRNERKKIMKNQRQKQNYQTMEPLKKRLLLEKVQAKDTANKDELLKKRAQKYKTMDTAKKQELLNQQAEKYKAMDRAKKQNLLIQKAEKYKTMDITNKRKLLNKQTERYKTMDSAKKQELLNRRKQKYHNDKNNTEDSCIEKFKKKIREGPYYICCMCNRTL